MKKSLTLLAIYFMLLIFGTVFFAAVFMVGSDLTSVVAGQPVSFFSLNFFFQGVRISFPLVCIVTFTLLILYLIRHPGDQILPLITYSVLGLLTWIILIPIDLKSIETSEDFKLERRQVSSAGVFRSEETGVFLFTKINENGNADGIFIDVHNFSGEDGKVITFENLHVSNENAFPYSDILIKDSIEPPHFVTYPLAVYTSVLTAAVDACSTGLLAWFCFATFGLALLAVYGLQFFSSWKLASALVVITAEIIVVFVNYLYYMNFIPAGLKEISNYLSKTVSIQNPLIVFVNLIICGILLAYGILMGIYRKRKNAGSEDTL